MKPHEFVSYVKSGGKMIMDESDLLRAERDRLYAEAAHKLAEQEKASVARLKAMQSDLAQISADLDAIVKESKRLKAQNHELREALQFLCDYQNGPPLYKYETQWTKAMTLARAALNQSPGD